ncbi:hypothetical protein K438DRAFT_1987624 [Mycena galopus ATCC 62051]|nr:hypothetical protein K438DRAFT_1987624 [Mycena galopus ATCC 62051]
MSSSAPSGTNSEENGVGVITPSCPFDSQDADVILRTSDGADFRLHKAVLSLVSPVFWDMFMLPQPHSDDTALPVVKVSEDSVTLDRALRFFYPGTQPVVENLNQLQDIIGVLVQKYDAQCLIPTAKHYLDKHAVAEPLAAYVVACRY